MLLTSSAPQDPKPRPEPETKGLPTSDSSCRARSRVISVARWTLSCSASLAIRAASSIRAAASILSLVPGRICTSAGSCRDISSMGSETVCLWRTGGLSAGALEVVSKGAGSEKLGRRSAEGAPQIFGRASALGVFGRGCGFFSARGVPVRATSSISSTRRCISDTASSARRESPTRSIRSASRCTSTSLLSRASSWELLEGSALLGAGR